MTQLERDWHRLWQFSSFASWSPAGWQHFYLDILDYLGFFVCTVGGSGDTFMSVVISGLPVFVLCRPWSCWPSSPLDLSLRSFFFVSASRCFFLRSAESLLESQTCSRMRWYLTITAFPLVCWNGEIMCFPKVSHQSASLCLQDVGCGAFFVVVLEVRHLIRQRLGFTDHLSDGHALCPPVISVRWSWWRQQRGDKQPIRAAGLKLSVDYVGMQQLQFPLNCTHTHKCGLIRCWK